MKYPALLLALLVSSLLVSGQAMTCADFRTGVFQFPGASGGVYTVIRTDSTQFERASNEAGHSVMKIRWTGDCSYILYDRLEYRRGEVPSSEGAGIELRNVVYKVEQPDKFYVKTFAAGIPDTVETVFTRLDTAKTYNNLFQRPEFAEYKNSKSYGQTLLGEIHSISYYESNAVPDKYLIVFETTYHGEILNKSRLLDSVVVHLKKGEQIANSNCRFDGKYDDEIVAIYHSTDEEKEAVIVRAFRCNRATRNLEEVEARNVQYKEADRHRIRW
jgi:hypothetical protein